MGKKVSKKGKGSNSKQLRRQKERRHKLIRLGLIYLFIIILCVGFLAAMSIVSHSARTDPWRSSDREKSAVIDAEGVMEDGDNSIEVSLPLASETPTPAPTLEPTPASTAEVTPEPTPEATQVPEEVAITITAAGDCTLGGSVHQDTYQDFKRAVQRNGYDYFFDNVRQVFVSDDLTIINLEGPITDTGKARRGMYCFKGDPDYVNIMTGSSVELCTVANNHSIDFGIAGLKRTAELLEQAGIGCCGYTKVYRTVIKGIRITALGFDKWQNNREGIEQAIRQERPDCDILIVNMHWGREKVYEPMSQQKEWGHAAIDAGADLVIGHHPHVYGGVECYKGKYIAYSLGNFCFGGNGNPSDKRCLMFQQTLVVRSGGQVSDGGINIIACSISSVSNNNDFRPTPMNAEDGAKLLKAVAVYSNLGKDTRWMANSYPEQIGLISAQPVTAGLTGQAVNVFQTVAAQPTPVPEATALPPVAAEATMIPGITVEPRSTDQGGAVQTPAAADVSTVTPEPGASAFDFGDVQESVYDDDELNDSSEAITPEQVQAGVNFSEEQLKNAEMAAKELLYQDQMQNE